MQIASAPLVSCRRATLPFDEPLQPVKAGLPLKVKGRAS